MSDEWEGLEEFLTPGVEVLVCRTTEDVLEALALPHAELARIAHAARERVLQEHTAEQRVLQLEEILASTPAHPSGLRDAGRTPSCIPAGSG